MEIPRQIHLTRLIARQGNGMIKVITGMRRSGKSYLLFTLFHNYLLQQGVDEQHIIKVALEDRRNAALRDPDALLAFIDSRMPDNRQYYIILDEVQLVSEFEDVLNSYLKVPNADIYYLCHRQQRQVPVQRYHHRVQRPGRRDSYHSP